MNLIAALMLDFERQDLNLHPTLALLPAHDRRELLKTIVDMESSHSIEACAAMMRARDDLPLQVAA